MKIKTSRVVFLLVLSLLLAVNFALARDKNTSSVPQYLEKPVTFGETIINIGALQNWVSNSTITAASGEDVQTFIIGKDDLSEPSFRWSEGGYALNDYHYYGTFRIGVNNNFVRLSTLTSEDFTVKKNDPDEVSPFEISYSMDDHLAGALTVGVTVKQTVHAWSESYRDDFFIYEWDVINTSGNALADVYVGIHMDSDVSAAAGGAGEQGFWRDDFPNHYLGTDAKGNAESISYINDDDNPTIAGNDFGGRLTPKESLGFIGSRVIECPPSSDGLAPANQQSGHQWWDWNSDPADGSAWYNLMQKKEFKVAPGSPHDYRYFQLAGPFAIAAGDTLHYAAAIGIGEGLAGLRKNMQWAYDLYWNDFNGPAAPNAPVTTIEKGDGKVTITWDDTTAERSIDPLSLEADFEGYRLYRSLDKTNWTVLADFDVVDDIGDNTGLPPKMSANNYQYIDNDVLNGFLYYYTVAAYDRGSSELSSLENGKRVDLFIELGPSVTSTKLEAEKVRVVPNPFVVKAPWDFTPTNENPAEERLQFQNVPKGAKITVFNLAGDKIIELYQSGENGYVNWDLITRNVQKVVSGLYLYVVEAENGDTHIDKFVIVR